MSRRIEDLEPEVAHYCRELIRLCSLKNIQIRVVQTLRTLEEQALLYAKGRELEGPVVTNAMPGSSWHNYGRAFDVAFVNKYNGIIWDGPWDDLGGIGEKLGLTWGGHFKTILDRPHFEFHPGWAIVDGKVKKGSI